ncbi:MAG: hypothetical protein JO165_04230 [Candidatus Eremiobacteraeota bacterium]|nr:hypothetical protein [Candidatus Eremiobacteraeota bacterium]
MVDILPLFFASAMLLGTAIPSTPALQVHYRLDPDHIILGQPVWIAVTMTNRSDEALLAEGVSNCFDSHLHVDVPGLRRREADASSCAHRTEDCQTEFVDIAPGETVTRRYTLSGNFVMTAPGNYTVVVNDTIRFGNSSSVGSAN